MSWTFRVWARDAWYYTRIYDIENAGYIHLWMNALTKEKGGWSDRFIVSRTKTVFDSITYIPFFMVRHWNTRSLS